MDGESVAARPLPGGSGGVFDLYGHLPLGARLFVRIRWALSDLPFVESFLPREGLIVELGCGHGLFSNLAALRSDRRQVLGADLSEEKVRVARTTIKGRRNVSFELGDATTFQPPEPCDAVAIVDVMYLLTPETQRRVLANCFRMLRPGGLLVWKSQETRPPWKYWITCGQERLATGIGFTLHSSGALHFLSREDSLAALSHTGFVAEVVNMPSWRPYTDILFLGRKPASP